MDYGISGKVALVNGGSSGIGLGIARALAAEGVHLALCAQQEGKLAQAAEALKAEFGVRVAIVSADVSQPNAAENVVAQASAALGAPDILVNNSGGPAAGTFEELSEDQWAQAAQLLLMNAVRFSRAALPHMKAQRWGRILNVCSTSVKEPIAGLMLSNALRSSVIGFAKTLSQEAGPYGVTVNNLLPGRIHTGRLEALAARQGRPVEEVFEGWIAEIPLRRLGTPADVGALAAFLASEPAGFLTGLSIPVDGGMIHGV